MALGALGKRAISMGGRKAPKKTHLLQGVERGVQLLHLRPLLVPSVMEAVTTRTISLLTTDVKTSKFIAVSRGQWRRPSWP